MGAVLSDPRRESSEQRTWPEYDGALAAALVVAVEERVLLTRFPHSPHSLEWSPAGQWSAAAGYGPGTWEKRVMMVMRHFHHCLRSSFRLLMKLQLSVSHSLPASEQLQDVRVLQRTGEDQRVRNKARNCERTAESSSERAMRTAAAPASSVPHLCANFEQLSLSCRAPDLTS